MDLVGDGVGPDEDVCLRGGWCVVGCRATTRMVVAVDLELHALSCLKGRRRGLAELCLAIRAKAGHVT